MADIYAPELVIAFVAPSGIDFDEVADAAAARLNYYGYASSRIRLSDYLLERRKESNRLSAEDERFLDRRIPALQDEGDSFRSETGQGDALAFVAVNEVRANRVLPEEPLGSGVEQETPAAPKGAPAGPVRSPDEPAPRRAYLIWSLKHPSEVETLRNIYRSRFVLISVYAPRENREADLAQKIADSRGDVGHGDKYRDRALAIIATDESETGLEFGQDVRDAYPLADFFVDGSNPPELLRTMNRSIDIAFGAPFETPRKDEYGMFVAHAAGLRSAELGRQVGASITSNDGEVIAVGTNEVPRGGGGQYWPEDYPHDHREFRLSSDTSDRMKRSLVGQVLEVLREEGWIVGDRDEATTREMYEALRETRIRDLIEFVRAVHAEMGAVTDAARRGVAVKGHTMYVTTFPCHHCARHIVAAGIRRVVYIYPYAKSLAGDLHGDAVQTEMLSLSDPRKVRFEPFLGVAPRQYMTFFTMSTRKDPQGNAYPVDDPGRTPRLVEEERTGVWNVNAYIEREQLALDRSASWFAEPESTQENGPSEDGESSNDHKKGRKQ